MGDVNKKRHETPVGTVKTKVAMGMKVLRADGSVEEHGEQFQQVVELDYESAVALFGQMQADTLFSGVERANDDAD